MNLGAMPDTDKKKSYRMMADQFGKNIGSIVIGLECGEAAQEVLEAPSTEGSNPSCSGDGKGVQLQDRSSWQYHVVRMNEAGKNAILIAARTSLFERLELLEERNFHEKGHVQSRILICKAFLRKPCSLGNSITIAGFHGHCETMKRTNPTHSERVWRETAGLLKLHDVDLLGGDFNMWMLKVPETLRSYDIICDTLAYYPFQLGADIEPAFPIRIGLDSMGFFWLKGEVEAWVNWPYSHIERLKAAGNPSCSGVQNDWNEWLDYYKEKGTFPGQHFSRYRATDAKHEGDSVKDFEKSMREFLKHSTPVEIWKNRRDKEGRRYWHVLKQKKCDPSAYYVDGKYWGGTHLPLVVFTEGATCRGAEAKKARHQQSNWRGHTWRAQDSADGQWQQPIR